MEQRQLSATAPLFPSTTALAPLFSQFGGNYAGGFMLSMTNPNTGGTILYTLDGSDPRLVGGGQNADAKTYTGPFLLSGNVAVKARYLSPGGEWSALEEAPFLQTSIGLYPGDFNRDGSLSAADLPAMLSALTDLDAYLTSKSLSPTDLVAIGDLSGDGNVSNRDIQPLLDALAGVSTGAGAGSGSAAAETSSPQTLVQAVVSTVAVTTVTTADSSDAVASLLTAGPVAPFQGITLLAVGGATASTDFSATLSGTHTSNAIRSADPTAGRRADDFYRELSISTSQRHRRGPSIWHLRTFGQPETDVVDDLLAEIAMSTSSF